MSYLCCDEEPSPPSVSDTHSGFVLFKIAFSPRPGRLFFFFQGSGAPRDLPSSPTRRSPDLLVGIRPGLARQHARVGAQPDHLVAQPAVLELVEQRLCGGDDPPRVDRRLRVDGSRQLGQIGTAHVRTPVTVETPLPASP